MNILLVIDYLGVGGAEAFVLRLARALSEQHHQVGVFEVFPERHNARFVAGAFMGSNPVTIHQWQPSTWRDRLAWYSGKMVGSRDLHGRVQAWRNPKRKAAFHHALAMGNYQVINSHLIRSDRFVAENHRGLPYIISMHGSYEREYKNISEQGRDMDSWLAVVKPMLEGAGAITIASEKNRLVPELAGLPPGRLQKVYYGYTALNKDPQSSKTHPGGRLVYGMVARGHEDKGWRQVLKAFRQVHAQYPDTRLELAYSDTAYMREVERESACEPGVVFHGFRDDVPAMLAGCDVGLLPTTFSGESLPNSVIEYLGAGIPVIATDIGDIPDMLTGESSLAGQLLPLDASGAFAVSDLASAMKRYMEDAELWQQHRAQSGPASAKFDMGRCSSAYIEIFERCLFDLPTSPLSPA